MINWFKTSFAQIGKAATFYYIADKFLQSTRIGSIYPYYFFSQPLDDENKKVRLSKGYEIKRIAEGDPALLTILNEKICQYRFKQNAICVGAFKENKLVALLWFTPGMYNEDEVRADFIPPINGCWDFGVHVEPELRLTRVFSNLWIASTEIMKNMGFTESLSRISAFNPGSLKAHMRMGAKLKGKAIFMNIGSVQFSFSNRKPCFHVSFSEKSRVKFLFVQD